MLPRRLDGKRAVVTGAGQGMGRAAAIAFLHEGAEVWALDLNEATLGTLRDEAAGINTAR